MFISVRLFLAGVRVHLHKAIVWKDILMCKSASQDGEECPFHKQMSSQKEFFQSFVY